MTDALDQFFSAWSEADPDTRTSLIGNAMAPAFTYADPRSDGAMDDLTALCAYVGQFTESAPGWSATVLKTDAVAGHIRCLVGFGDDGGIQQHGQYFATTDKQGRLTRLVGFAGIGAPE